MENNKKGLAERLGYKNKTAFAIHLFLLILTVILAVYMVLYDIPASKTQKICIETMFRQKALLDRLCAFRQQELLNYTFVMK